jgi:hypothetical protein
MSEKNQDKICITQQSKSLFNTSNSKGWTKEENHVLKLSIIKYGVGNFKN